MTIHPPSENPEEEKERPAAGASLLVVPSRVPYLRMGRKKEGGGCRVELKRPGYDSGYRFSFQIRGTKKDSAPQQVWPHVLQEIRSLERGGRGGELMVLALGKRGSGKTPLVEALCMRTVETLLGKGSSVSVRCLKSSVWFDHILGDCLKSENFDASIKVREAQPEKGGFCLESSAVPPSPFALFEEITTLFDGEETVRRALAHAHSPGTYRSGHKLMTEDRAHCLLTFQFTPPTGAPLYRLHFLDLVGPPSSGPPAQVPQSQGLYVQKGEKEDMTLRALNRIVGSLASSSSPSPSTIAGWRDSRFTRLCRTSLGKGGRLLCLSCIGGGGKAGADPDFDEVLSGCETAAKWADVRQLGMLKASREFYIGA